MGQIILVPVTMYLILTYGWRMTYLFWTVAIIILTLPIAIFMIRNNPEDSGYLPDGETANDKLQMIQMISKYKFYGGRSLIRILRIRFPLILNGK